MKRANFQLTPHFSYADLTRSAWAWKYRVSNTPDALQTAALKNLAHRLLEPLYLAFGPIAIDNAFRSPCVNEGMHGLGQSKHLSGEAVDIRLPDLETGRAYYRFILANVDFDQMLFEYRRPDTVVLHCSVCYDDRENRHQAFPNYLNL